MAPPAALTRDLTSRFVPHSRREYRLNGTSIRNVKSYTICVVSPTVFREAGFRFYFFSREEPRMHVHVHGQNGEAKFWLEPQIKLAQNFGLQSIELAEALRLITEHEHDIRTA